MNKLMKEGNTKTNKKFGPQKESLLTPPPSMPMSQYAGTRPWVFALCANLAFVSRFSNANCFFISITSKLIDYKKASTDTVRKILEKKYWREKILVEKSLQTPLLLEPHIVHTLLSLCSGQNLPVINGQP